jgi:serine protease Do
MKEHAPAWMGLVASLGIVGAFGCDIQGKGAPWGSHSEVAIPPGATAVPSALAASAAPSAAPLAPPSRDLAVRLEPVSFAPIAHGADPSVVTITTVGQDVEVSPFTHRRRRVEERGLGTGFVVDRGGVILTNNHVVEGADAILVKLFDEREFPGHVAGTDPLTDIAVVKIDASDLKPLPLGDSEALDVGDWVVAIGNPFGLSHTVSAGIVSAKGRTQEDVRLDPSGYYDFLQTDASINPGNSGGPLLNLRGEVVGVNTAIRGGGAQGIGFAIPINMIKQLLPMLLRDGRVTRSALGVRIADVHQLAPEDRAALGLPAGARVSGAVVEYVLPDGSAAHAGLQPGDLIVGFEGQAIERSAQLQWLASTAGVGRVVSVRIRRGAAQFDTRLTLGSLDDGTSSAPAR